MIDLSRGEPVERVAEERGVRAEGRSRRWLVAGVTGGIVLAAMWMLGGGGGSLEEAAVPEPSATLPTSDGEVQPDGDDAGERSGDLAGGLPGGGSVSVGVEAVEVEARSVLRGSGSAVGLADLGGTVLAFVLVDGVEEGPAVAVWAADEERRWGQIATVDGVAEVAAFTASETWVFMAGVDSSGYQRVWWSSDGVVWRSRRFPRRFGAFEVADVAVLGDGGYVAGRIERLDALLPEAAGPVLADALRSGIAWVIRTDEGLGIVGPLFVPLWQSQAGDGRLLEAWDAQSSSAGLWRIDLVGDGGWERVSSLDGLATSALAVDGDLLVADEANTSSWFRVSDDGGRTWERFSSFRQDGPAAWQVTDGRLVSTGGTMASPELILGPWDEGSGGRRIPLAPLLEAGIDESWRAWVGPTASVEASNGWIVVAVEAPLGSAFEPLRSSGPTIVALVDDAVITIEGTSITSIERDGVVTSVELADPLRPDGRLRVDHDSGDVTFVSDEGSDLVTLSLTQLADIQRHAMVKALQVQAEPIEVSLLATDDVVAWYRVSLQGRARSVSGVSSLVTGTDLISLISNPQDPLDAPPEFEVLTASLADAGSDGASRSGLGSRCCRSGRRVRPRWSGTGQFGRRHP